MSDAEVNIAFGLVKRFFNDDFHKAYVWWRTDNPTLGNVSPQRMVELGRSAKLLKWVRQQIAENEP